MRELSQRLVQTTKRKTRLATRRITAFVSSPPSQERKNNWSGLQLAQALQGLHVHDGNLDPENVQGDLVDVLEDIQADGNCIIEIGTFPICINWLPWF